MKKLIRFDWAVKRLLRNKANFSILEGFLSELLYEDIRIESILESESNKQTGDNKSNRVDMLVRNTRDELIIIEIQSNRVQDHLMRMLYGTSKLVVDNMDMGMPYNLIKKVISINIVYFDLGHGEDYIYHGTTRFEGTNKHDILMLSPKEQAVYHTDSIASIYPEYYIIKVNQFNDIAKNTLDEWVYFLKNEEIKDEFKAKGIIEAKDRLAILKLSEDELKDYESFIKDWRYNDSLVVSNWEGGKAVGKIEGRDERDMEIVLNCLQSKLSMEVMKQITGLTEVTIEAIKMQLATDGKI